MHTCTTPPLAEEPATKWGIAVVRVSYETLQNQFTVASHYIWCTHQALLAAAGWTLYIWGTRGVGHLREGVVEVKVRSEDDRRSVPQSDAVDYVKGLLA